MRVADVQLAGAFDKALHEFVADPRIHVNPLDRDTHLPGVGEAAGHAARHGFVEIGVVFHDDRRVRAQLERDALHAGQIANAQSDLNAAGERHHGDALIEHQHVADRAAGPGNHIQRARWKSALLEDAGHANRGHRRGGCRLVHHAVAARQRRPNLVHRQVQREVERRHRGDHAERLAHGHGPVSFAGRRSVHGDDFSAQPMRLFGGKQQREGGALDFKTRLLDGLARLGTDRHRHLVAVVEQSLVSLAQNGRAFVCRHLPHDRSGRRRGRDGRVHLLARGLINRANFGSVVWQPHRTPLGARHRLAADVHRIFHVFIIGRDRSRWWYSASAMPLVKPIRHA